MIPTSMDKVCALAELEDVENDKVQLGVTTKRKTFRSRFGFRKMYLAAFSALFMSVIFGTCSGFTAPATYDMLVRQGSTVKPTTDEITWIGSVLALGIMAGGLLGGPTADKLGRKDTLVLTIIPFGLGWLMICYATSAITVIFGRFFCGFAGGIVSVAVPMYCVEISTVETRGFLGSSFHGFFTVGNLITIILGSYVMWNYLAVNGLIFCIFGTSVFCFMPESPRWLLTQGRVKEATRVIHELQEGFVNEQEECDAMHKELDNKSKGKLSFEEFTHPTVLKPTLLALISFLFHQFSGSAAVISYSSEIFEISKGFMDPRKATIVLGVVQVLATLSSNLIIDKVGRKVLLILSGILMALTLTTLGTYYYMSVDDVLFQSKYSWIPLLSLVLFMIAFAIGFGPIPYLLMAEMLPVRARSRVSGLVNFMNGFFAFIVSKTFNWLEEFLESYGAFWFYSCASTLSVLFVALKIPETKGKKLEEIEELFYKKEKGIIITDMA